MIAFAAMVAGGARAENERVTGSSRLSELLSDRGATDRARALEPREFSFPDDHGPHPAYRNEWWYVTGNLDGPDNERFGFELTIFRFALTPAAEPEPDASAWRTDQVYIGHFAVTDVENEQFHVSQRYARGTLGLAGASSDPFHIWVENWWLKEFPAGDDPASTWLLHARNKDIELTLTLVPGKPPVTNGIDGLSQKSAEPGNATYYYSMSRLQSSGTLRIGDDIYDVSGLSWLDREWGSSALSKEQQGWDWFALQLSDGSDLMFYKLRRNDGTADSHSAGTWIPAAGDNVHLSHDDVTIDVHKYWDSPAGGRYPMAWTISVPVLDLALQVDPVLDAQELNTDVRYWEGAVDVIGQRKGQEVTGRGYVELTGYANPE